MAEFVLVLNVSKMASSVVNRRDYWNYIRASHPKIFLSSPQIYGVAAVCLRQLVDSETSQDVIDATSRAFIDYARDLYRKKAGGHYDRLIKLRWFDQSVEFKKPSPTPPTPPPTPVKENPPSKKVKLSFSEMGQRHSV